MGASEQSDALCFLVRLVAEAEYRTAASGLTLFVNGGDLARIGGVLSAPMRI